MMEAKNVCPYCGGTNIEAIRSDIHNNKKVPHQPNVHYYSRCADCWLCGPHVQAEDDDGHWYYSSWQDAQQAAIHALTHPAHLHTYDPTTHVCVSREAAIALLMNVRGIDDANFAAAELRAALEVGK
jgi:hypothetical protein